MIFGLLHLAKYSYLRKLNTDIKAEKEGKPTFQEIELAETYYDPQLKDIDTTLSGVYSSTQRTSEFYSSSITIKDSTQFIGNYAFGSAEAAGSGGAVFVANSMLTIDSDVPTESTLTDRIKFISNQAILGGALATLSSPIYLYKTLFQNYAAMKYGGGIFFQTLLTAETAERMDSSMQIIIKNSNFDSNTATEYGGAVAISSSFSSYFENCNIYDNHVSFAGAGLYVFNSNILKLFTCNFYRNKINNQVYRNFGSNLINNKQNLAKTSYNTRFRARGGGALCFVSDNRLGVPLDSLSTSTNKRTIDSTHCCFAGNNADDTSTSFGDGPGHELMFDGLAKWTSVEDAIKGYKSTTFNLLVSHTAKGWNVDSETAFEMALFAMSSDEYPNGYDWSTDTRTTPAESQPVPARESNTGNANLTSSVPSPTKYTYVATAITALTSVKTTNTKF